MDASGTPSILLLGGQKRTAEIVDERGEYIGSICTLSKNDQL
jgi:hypothetical protein